MSESKTVIIGDGWAALGAVGYLAQAGAPVKWITASGARMVCPLPSLELGAGVSAWEELSRRLGVDFGSLHTGSFLREFRNKGFREPAWTRSPTPEMRAETRNEILWDPETRFVGPFEARFDLSLADLEEAIRKAVSELPGIERIEGNPVESVVIEGGELRAIVLGSGERVECSRVLYADRWSLLPEIAGLPKPLSFFRGREPMGVLQATFTHGVPVGAGLMEGFFGVLHKEAGDEFQRHVLGHFSQDGTKSFWSVFLAPSESEDNHEIGKKLRRVKQALDKMFTGGEWVPEGKSAFMDNVVAEHVLFEDNIVMGGLKPPTEVVTLPKAKGMLFLTDGYGPSSALHQVAMALGEELAIPQKGFEELSSGLTSEPAAGIPEPSSDASPGA